MPASPAVLAPITIGGLFPTTPSGLPAKGAVGQQVDVGLDAFVDGHDRLAGHLRWRGPSAPTWHVAPLLAGANDRWEGGFTPEEVGLHLVEPVVWRDRWGTWLHGTSRKVEAGQDVAVELEDGARLLEERLAAWTTAKGGRKAGAPPGLDAVVDAIAALRAPDADDAHRLAAASSIDVALAMAGPLRAADKVTGPRIPIWVDRPVAACAAWYELFPRSEGGLRGAIERLPAIAAMGFDVVYLPPISPIGRTYRKGRGGSLQALPEDVGSPWAIGSEHGGHTAIEPSLGTLDDLAKLLVAAEELDLEIALDIAFQCSPDHPWVRDHPEWFTVRSDGSIAYAENPPKKYQDIHPIDFWPAEEADRVALWEACLDVFETWVQRGITTFRVDNPHTKPIAFWAWCIDQLRRRHPEVVFLSEAFTRPKVMAKLAEVGFSQSYTYYAWRVHKQELEEYLDEVSNGPTSGYLRPSFWPTTPDILAEPLRGAPLSVFALRLLLAATMVPLYGMYSGYELGENEPASPSNEEYADSEKYRVVERDWSQPAPLASLVTALNQIRRAHPALQRLRGAVVHGTDSDSLLCFSRSSADGSDVVLVVANLHATDVVSGWLDLDLEALGVATDAEYDVHDELTGETYRWTGANPWVRLDPAVAPGHVLHVRRVVGSQAP